MERTYYYLGGDALHSGMYVALIRRLEQQGLVTNLVTRIRVTLNPLSTWKAWKGRDFVGPNPIAQVRRRIRGRVVQVPIFAPLPALSVPSMAHILGESTPDRRIVLHTRQIVMGRLALALKRWFPEVRVICELEADTLAELDLIRMGLTPSPLTRVEWSAETAYYTRQERRLVRECDAVLCVSHTLREVLIRRYDLNAAEAAKLTVFPSVGDPSVFRFDPELRRELRQARGLDGRFVVVYTGNLRARWQVPDKLVEVFDLIREGRKDAYFLILTPDQDRPYIQTHLDRAGVPPEDYGMASAAHEEVVRYLCAADVALLLRTPHPANQAGAPGKFSEYMLSGLPTILTDGIGDFSEQVREAEFACVLPGLDRLGELKTRIQAFCEREVTAEQRLAQSRWAAERFSTDLWIAKLAALYRRV